MAYVGNISASSTVYRVASTLLGQCNSASSEPIKIITGCEDVEELLDGLTLAVKFSDENSAADISLSINNNVIPVLTNFSDISDNSYVPTWSKNSVILFTYTDSNWFLTSSVDRPLTDDELSAILV